MQSKKRLRRESLSLWELMLLVAGIAFSLWLTREVLQDQAGGGPVFDVPLVIRVAATILGGLSVVSVPLLLWRRRTRPFPWGPGKTSWFAQGAACWLLWPPVVYRRVLGESIDSMSYVCWLYGTPLMGLYVTVALLAGGWLGRRGRRRARHSWREQFGLLLMCLWACTGLYILYLIQGEELGK